MKFVVVQRTGFVPYFLYVWDGVEERWLHRRDLAKQFTRFEADRIAKQLNARRPGAPLPVVVAPA